ncbi:MAG: pentapeptide repeat-containing protein, partial [Desulfuromonadales bacterium]|nr:pentapeptide repeat-containing protein [Desulfuromonadales bacterium]NIS39951.1 pentapeptide repeat-containing protein [Desulfuromonadales bacterium]
WALLTGADLSEADLGDADLYGGRLGNASLRGTNLSGANLSLAELHLSSDLSQQQVSSACSDLDKPPRLPDSLQLPPACAE